MNHNLWIIYMILLMFHIHCSPCKGKPKLQTSSQLKCELSWGKEPFVLTIAETSESHKSRSDLTLLSILQRARVSLIVLKVRGIYFWLSFLILLELLIVVAPLGTLGTLGALALAISISIARGMLVVVDAEVVLQLLLIVVLAFFVVLIAPSLGAPVVAALAAATVHP
jgi:hypothetical protein